MRIRAATDIDTLDFAKGNGLLPVAVQHYATGELLMLGYTDAEAVRRSLADGVLWLYSRSRREYWRKGATSGNSQRLVSIDADCDGDALVMRVEPEGPMCHTGAASCFGAPPPLSALGHVIDERIADPSATGYTSALLRDENLRLKKLGEEAVELAVACVRGERESITSEAADLLYHMLVCCGAAGVSVDDILATLAARRRGAEDAR